MKKSLLTAAVVLGASAIVVAEQKDTPMALNQDGIGQVLIYPYYNVNDGFDTHFSVVNTSNTYRAVKVRINEGKNSWEVLDFNLYLSPKDVWSGVLHKYDNGTIRILTTDESCTLPTIPKAHEVGAFIDSGVPNQLDPALRYSNIQKFEYEKREDGKLIYRIEDSLEAYGENEAANLAYYSGRASEGYIEIIDMGQVIGELDKDGKNQLQAAIKHNSTTRKPGNCDAVLKFYEDHWGALGADPDYGIFTDGENALMGSATLINVGQGLSGGYNAVAIKNFVTQETDANGNKITIKSFKGGDAYSDEKATSEATKVTTRQANATLHNKPGSSYPNLNAQVERGLDNDRKPITKTVATANKFVQVNEAYEPTFKSEGKELKVTAKKAANGILDLSKQVSGDKTAVALSAVLMAQEVIGEYIVDPGLRSSSDWVITMPTKHFFVNPNTTDNNIGQYGFVEDKNASDSAYKKAVAPFNISVYERRALGTPIKIEYYDREETTTTVKPGVDFSPSIVGDTRSMLTAEASLVNFGHNQEGQLFNSRNRSQINLKENYTAGWATVKFSVDDSNNPQLSNAASADALTTGEYRLFGLPVVGISATKYVNGSVGGVLSNYMAIQNLNYKRNNQVGPSTPAESTTAGNTGAGSTSNP